jgi:uncharacterized membrane protein
MSIGTLDERVQPVVASAALVLLRYGLVAYGGGLLFADVLLGFPITTQVSAWYFGIGLTGLTLLLALALFAFYTSLGGQPMFGRALLEEKG